MHQCWWSSPGANWSLSPSQEQRAGRLTHVSLPMGLALLAHSLPHHGDSHTPSSASPASKSQGGSRAPLSQHPQAPPPTTDSPQPCNPPPRVSCSPSPVVSSWVRQGLGTARCGVMEGPGSLFALVLPVFAFDRPLPPGDGPFGVANLGLPGVVWGRCWGAAGPGYSGGTMSTA